MITRKIKGAKDLRDYYNKLVEMKDSVPKPISNVEYHNVITNLMKECNSYTEFGMCQGPTIAAAMFCHPQKVRGYDITFEWFGLAKNFFEDYAKENHIDFKVFKTDSATCSVIEDTDMLHIDSKHTYKHAIAELKKHAKKVNKYILLHDTTLALGIWDAVQEYITKVDTSWKVIKRSDVGVGYTILKREKNE